MPLTASVGSGGGIAGLTLRAWALVAANGTLLSGFNVSSVTKGSTGNYTANLAQAMPDTTVIHEVKFPFSPQARVLNTITPAVGSIAYAMTENAVFADVPHYLAIYGK